MLERTIQDKIAAIAAQFSKIERVYLFGSQAKPGAMKKSDIDLAVEANCLSEADYQLFIERLQTELGLLLPVDVSLAVEPAFQRRIRNEGHLLYGPELSIQSAAKNLRTALRKVTTIFNIKQDLGSDQIFLATDAVLWNYRQSFDLLLKFLKHVLRFRGINARSPRDLLIEANLAGWLVSEEQWLKYLGLRLRLDDIIYSAERAEIIVEGIRPFPLAVEELFQNIIEQEKDLGKWLKS